MSPQLQEGLLAGDVDRLTVNTPNSQDLHVRALWAGIIALTRNQPTQAIRILRHTGNPKALGVAYYMARQYILFRSQMEEAIRDNPEDFGPYYYLGRHYDTEYDNAGEAAAWFQKALEKNPEYLPARSFLGSCLERLGRIEEAERAYTASAALPPSQAGLARLRLASGDTDSALAFIEKALAMNPRDLASQKLAARIYGAIQRPRDALRALQEAAKLAPTEASIQYHISRTWLLLGEQARADSALREFERLRSIYGTRPQ